MNRRTICALVVLVITGCESSSDVRDAALTPVDAGTDMGRDAGVDIAMDASAPCAAEYVSATIAIGESVVDVCLPIDAEHHLQIGFGDPSCTLTSSGAVAEDEADFQMGIGADGDWFSREGIAEAFGVSYSSSSAYGCGGIRPGGVGNCSFWNPACAARVTLAAHAVNEFSEGDLAAPCELVNQRDWGWPTVTIQRLHFRAMVIAMPHQLTPGPDGSLCSYPIDAGH
ncbi:MAG: hypothetical protein IPK60_10835 [Sandaracinaceae bacterium]|jgi:hypothetical protein|nr:hypothetical protein [Sandaracinaceae bacterium]